MIIIIVRTVVQKWIERIDIMREILFRGKRVDNCEWVYGDLSQHKTGKVFIKTGSAIRSYEVIPENIGQYTGLTDQNAKRIYENDILNCEVVGIQYPAKVVFKNGSFGVAYTHRGIDYFNPFTSFVESVEFEIICNIHDNPELLEGESNESER